MVTISIVVSEEDKENIEVLSKKLDLNFSQFARRAIREYIDKIKKEPK